MVGPLGEKLKDKKEKAKVQDSSGAVLFQRASRRESTQRNELLKLELSRAWQRRDSERAS
jgi:hypothetical protein